MMRKFKMKKGKEGVSIKEHTGPTLAEMSHMEKMQGKGTLQTISANHRANVQRKYDYKTKVGVTQTKYRSGAAAATGVSGNAALSTATVNGGVGVSEGQDKPNSGNGSSSSKIMTDQSTGWEGQ